MLGYFSRQHSQWVGDGCPASKGDLGETPTASSTPGITVRLDKRMDPDILHFYLNLIFIVFPLNFHIVPSHV